MWNLFVIQFRINQRGLRIGVSKECLQFFERHTVPQADRGKGVPELVRIGMDAGAVTDILHDILQRMGLQLLVRRLHGHPERRVIVIP